MSINTTETDPHHVIELSRGLWLRIWQIENDFRHNIDTVVIWFIQVKHYSTDIEEHQVESMNRYHMFNKHFCKIQRQV